MKRSGLSPTDMANYAYCRRLFVLSRIFDTKRTAPSQYMVWGLYEHDVFRTLFQNLKKLWLEAGATAQLLAVAKPEIDAAIRYAYDIATQNYPHHTTFLSANNQGLRFRLRLWAAIQAKLVHESITRGQNFEQAVSTTLPWKVEDKISSRKLGIFGRTDAIYNDGETLIPEDIKTHDGKLSTLMHKESHKVQLLCYSVLSEETYGIPSNKSRIFFSKDLTYASFNISNQDKAALHQLAGEARDLLSQDLPPVLEGEESIKCEHCYLRTLCNEVAKKHDIQDVSEVLQIVPKESQSEIISVRGGLSS